MNCSFLAPVHVDNTLHLINNNSIPAWTELSNTLCSVFTAWSCLFFLLLNTSTTSSTTSTVTTTTSTTPTSAPAMAPADDPLAGELSVPKVGRRDGVGVCVSTGTLLSTAGVAPVEVPVGEEEKMEEVDTGHVNWHRDSVTGPLHTFAQSWKNMLPLVVVT